MPDPNASAGDAGTTGGNVLATASVIVQADITQFTRTANSLGTVFTKATKGVGTAAGKQVAKELAAELKNLKLTRDILLRIKLDNKVSTKATAAIGSLEASIAKVQAQIKATEQEWARFNATVAATPKGSTVAAAAGAGGSSTPSGGGAGKSAAATAADDRTARAGAAYQDARRKQLDAIQDRAAKDAQAIGDRAKAKVAADREESQRQAEKDARDAQRVQDKIDRDAQRKAKVADKQASRDKATADKQAAKDEQDQARQAADVQSRFDADLIQKQSASKAKANKAAARDDASKTALQRAFPTFTSFASSNVDPAKSGATGGGKGAGKGGKGGRDYGYGLLALGSLADDSQYGFRSIANNIPVVVAAFTGSAGIAGAAGIASTAINLLITHFDDLKTAFIGADVKSQAEQMAELGRKTALTAKETERLRKFQAQQANVEAQKGGQSEIQATQQGGVNKAIDEFGYQNAKNAVLQIPEYRDRINGSIDEKDKDEFVQARGIYQLRQSLAKQRGEPVADRFVKEYNDAYNKLQAAGNKKLEEFLADLATDEDKLRAFSDKALQNPSLISKALPSTATRAQRDAETERARRFAADLNLATGTNVRRAQENEFRVNPIVAGFKDELLDRQITRVGRGETIDAKANADLNEDLRTRLGAAGVDPASIAVAIKTFSESISKEAIRTVKERGSKDRVDDKEAARRLSAERSDARISKTYGPVVADNPELTRFVYGQAAKNENIDLFNNGELRKQVETEIRRVRPDAPDQDVQDAGRILAKQITEAAVAEVDKTAGERQTTPADAARKLIVDLDRQVTGRKIGEVQTETEAIRNPGATQLKQAQQQHAAAVAAVQPPEPPKPPKNLTKGKQRAIKQRQQIAAKQKARKGGARDRAADAKLVTRPAAPRAPIRPRAGQSFADYGKVAGDLDEQARKVGQSLILDLDALRTKMIAGSQLSPDAIDNALGRNRPAAADGGSSDQATTDLNKQVGLLQRLVDTNQQSADSLAAIARNGVAARIGGGR